MTSALPSGLVIVDKGPGLTSHDVVARVRRLAGTRKVGHAGTLDPMATGVLVLGVERATRLLGHLMLTEKSYDATVRLGASTTTDDAEGETLSVTSASHLLEAAIRDAFASQVGDIEQVPTKVSAIKVDGKRAYALAREGVEVELKARPVTIHELAVHDVRASSSSGGPDETIDVDISVRCSSGTYIRAIARDVGALLGVGGHLTALRRTAVGPYTLDDARTVEQLTESFEMLPISDAARAAFPAYELVDDQEREVRYGRKLPIAIDSLTAVFAPSGEFLALYEPAGPSTARPTAVFVG
ncbi:tRNA pseudouridine(55) synthase TruB [Nocardioides sp. Kera G14]|uniref:tRNA pseudouridine(55) synthase TruB n=1 Tax=Nocardioides sp. Kera G14 TaxID=2884264 RepID=UPI001D10657C|nr:tRNA pseudouridine(55) synthase TruB [Nocardioides sp. Kera G14]UDY22568.1 tRNA pseudouridine(55) synthase TruB [Nocardioides sp. Kera G14]